MQDSPYAESIGYCEQLLELHGDTSAGVGWPRNDADTRYRVMLDLVRPSRTSVSLLDFGSGASHFLKYIRDHELAGIRYEGLDLSDRFLSLSREKFPTTTYHKVDLLNPSHAPLPMFDYVVMNGIFNFRGNMSDEAMFEYLRRLVPADFDHARIGIAFNVMSKQVDREHRDLLHLPVDTVLTFLAHDVSRHW